MVEILRKIWEQKNWLASYVFQHLKGEIGSNTLNKISSPVDFIISVANHFEPNIVGLGLKGAVESIKEWCRDLEKIDVTDYGGNHFKHTYYFPAEQYLPELLFPLKKHCENGFGEVEIHLHHGEKVPDTAENLRYILEEFKKRLRDHEFLCYDKNDSFKEPRYCFVHGNWALGNSADGEFCGVDNELQILAETGCFADCTLPSAPNKAQVSKINSVYQCGLPLNKAVPHRKGKNLAVGDKDIIFPIVFQGPLLIDWNRWKNGINFPRIENSVIHDYSPPTIHRFNLWINVHIHVIGRPNWIFIKLHTHSLQDDHFNSIRGPIMKQFLKDLYKLFNDGNNYRLHFTSSRESVNIILAAIDGKDGNPNDYRNYRFILLN